MFIAEGFSSLGHVRQMMTHYRLPPDRLDLLRKKVARKIVILNLERGETGMRTIPDDVEMETLISKVDKYDVDRQIIGYLPGAVRNYARTVPLYLCGPNSPALVVGKSILKINVRGQEEREFVFLSNSLHVDVSDLEKTIEAAKILLGGRIEVPKMFHHRLSRIIDLEPECRVLRPFDGYTLCVENSCLPSEKQIQEAYGVSKDEKAPDDAKVPNLGRPRKKEAAVAAYDDCYPEGHDGYSWPEVVKRLRVEAGVIVSADTLKAGLREREENNAENP